MADTAPPDDALRHLEWVQRFYDEDLTDQELARFNTMLRESSELRRVFVDYSKYCSIMSEALGVASLWQAPDDGVEQVFGLARDDQPVSRLMTEAEHGQPLTMREITSAASYLTRHALLRKPAVLTGIAAALALVATLFLFFQGGSAPQSQPTTQAPGPETTVARPVAALTAERDAVWDRRPGQDLYANQRFTLMQGFAEITTEHGAVAILEAPATIELIDNPNAIRLNTGRLVGICETERSQGFLVRTPHTDVTDLGTVFGVDCKSTGTTVDVFEGEARVERDHGEAQHLTQGEAASAPADSAELLRMASRPGLYPRSWEQVDRGVRAMGKGACLFTPPTAVRSEAFENDDRIVVFRERRSTALGRDLLICLDKPGRWARFPDQAAAPIRAGTSVDSYIIHYDPVGQPDEVVKATADFVFDRPILGVIVRPERLRETDHLVGHPSVGYPEDADASSGIEGLEFADRFSDTDKSSLDIVRVSPDRRTLSITLFSSKHVDQIRVLTEASDTRP